MAKKDIKRKVKELDAKGEPTGRLIDKVIGFYIDDPEPADAWKVYEYPRFVKQMLSTIAGGLVWDARKTSPNVELLLEYGRTFGEINFNDDEQRAILEALSPSVLTAARLKSLIGGK